MPFATTVENLRRKLRGMWILALRNVTRHKLRTGMTLAAIVAGVASLVLSGGFVQDIFVQLREFTIHSQTGHLQIYREGYYRFGAQAPTKYIIEDTKSLASQLRSMPEVDDVMARLKFSGLLSNGRSDNAIIGEGVEPEREERLGTYVNMIAGRNLRKDDNFGVTIGEGVAKAQKLVPGDRVTLLLNSKDGALNSLDLEVIGVFRTFSKEYDARAVRVPLPAAQELLGTPGANSIVVSLKKTDATDRVARSLASDLKTGGYELKTWFELSDFYAKTVDLYDRQFGMLQLIILGMVLLGVANSVNMSVFERVGEFGTMMALGDRSRDVFGLIMLENATLGLIGAFGGVIVGIVLALIISAIGISMPPPPNSNAGYTAIIRIVPMVLAGAFFIGTAAAIGAAILPARRASRKEVAEALRHNI
jgi:putative ABC transport system permease protein